MENRPLVNKSQLSFIMQRPVSCEITEALNILLNLYEINTKQRIRHFLTQLGYESNGLTVPFNSIAFCWNSADLNQKVDDGWSVKQIAQQLPSYSQDLQTRYSYYNRCIEAIK